MVVDLTRAGGLVLAGADAGPGRQSPRGVEHAHVGAGLGDDDIGDRDGDARDRDQHVPGGTKGHHRVFDPGGEPVDHPGLRVDLDQVLADQERVMLGEPALQRVDQLRDLVPQRALRELGERLGVAFPGDQRVQHRPRRRAGQCRRDRGEFDPGGFEELLQTLHLPGPVPGRDRAGTGEVPQLPDRFRRHERRPQQPVR